MHKTLVFFLIAVSFLTSFAKNKPVLALDFHATTTKNKEIRLSDFQNKVVLIDFWASWCMPCRKEFPFLIDLYNQNRKKDFIVLAVNLDENRSNMDKFIQKLSRYVPFPVLIDDKGKIPTLYNIKAMPTTILVDKHGFVRFVHKGFKKSYKEEYLREVETLLFENPNQTATLPKQE